MHLASLVSVCLLFTACDGFPWILCCPIGFKTCTKFPPDLWDRCCAPWRKPCKPTTKPTTTTTRAPKILTNAMMLGFDDMEEVSYMTEEKGSVGTTLTPEETITINLTNKGENESPSNEKYKPKTFNSLPYITETGTKSFSEDTGFTRVTNSQTISAKRGIEQKELLAERTKITSIALTTSIPEITKLPSTSGQLVRTDVSEAGRLPKLTSTQAPTNESRELQDFRVFGSIYIQRVLNKVKEQGIINLSKSQVKFTQEGLVGTINFELGYSEMDTNLKLVGLPSKSTTSDRLELSYIFKIPVIIITYWFLIKLNDDSISGIIEIKLRDQQLEVRISATKGQNGSCIYKGEVLDVKLELKRYNTTFVIQHNVLEKKCDFKRSEDT